MADARERDLARLAESQHSVFSTGDADRAGLSRGRRQRRSHDEWTRLHRGVFRSAGAAPSWYGDLEAAVLAGGEFAAISHRTAAAVHGLPGGTRRPIEIVCRRWERARRPGLVVHESRRISEADITDVDGIAVVRAELAILQLAGWKPYPNYVEAAIHAARRNRLVTYESTLATFARHATRGLRGVRAMRVALERWNPANAPTESEMETLLLQTIRDHDFPEPVLQFEVLDRNGLFVARTDAAMPWWKITIEYQSVQEHLDEFQVAADDRRRNRILAAGYFPLVARIGDLRAGGHELAEQIRDVARRSA
jgi:hypothetical protein